MRMHITNLPSGVGIFCAEGAFVLESSIYSEVLLPYVHMAVISSHSSFESATVYASGTDAMIQSA
jgi:hypothetical protein